VTRGLAPVVLVHGALVAAAGQQARRAARAERARARLRPREAWVKRTPSGRRRWELSLARRAARDDGALADVVDVLASGLASGVPAIDALDAAARSAPAGLAASMDAIVTSARAGVPVGQALQRWTVDDSSPDGAGLVAAAFAIASATGGDPAAGLAGVGATLRERRALAREVHALASQARASATVIALAPAGFALLTAGLGGTAARFLLGSPAGVACLVAGVGLDVTGWRWMRRITESVR
jgi:tight adherence protein B